MLDNLLINTVDGLSLGAIYALVALGYTMVYGVLRLINFAHSEIFLIGTCASLVVVNAVAPSAPLSGVALLGIVLLMAAVAMVASGAGAMALEFVAYRPLRKHGASRLAALISAIGASLFLQQFFALFVIPWLFDKPKEGGRLPVQPEQHFVDRHDVFSIGGVGVANDKLIVFIAAILMMVVLDQFVNRTKLGRGIRSTAQDPETAVLMGVNIDRIVTATFAIGGAMAGVAAALYVLRFEETFFMVGFLLGIKAFTAAVLGGIGNIRGALTGGFVLGLLEMYGSMVFGSAWKDVVAFVILILVLMFRPTGILGESLQQARA
ncbi:MULTISPECIES: branched-chain amino acid ABC transporter permease [Thermomonospora]|uniref:Inner-membrane translocator n=1 Tax=Thermomonospora curvata (strain ATCC 19995 / DSM 43183 / JCM 3096 / KCTC 9072 / NBRC 15933 / NCIMB 10081 / Henssen B9) TaxID=471852 RepID=D1A6Z9_THECD|nr:MULTISPECIES: branched-chain amino acid ABC transporter permease [Thermomonospora]ACY98403.1 inner-membrane translocator [Thermomonospora curvata DSM 43183]PKK13556.1 MAG: branched-chain amino acid ABC transporter permease [Thermomonospora sp. CIF 1]